MSGYIVACKCSGSKEQAEMAFRIAYPKAEVPSVYRGADAIISLADKHPNTNLAFHLKAIAKKNGKFAYYIEEEGGDISMKYDLFKGKKVA